MMNLNKQEIGKKLNTLVQKNYDAEKGYQKAAANTKSLNLKEFFEKKSKERNNFGHALKYELSSYGQKVVSGGSPTGFMHKTWIDVKVFFSQDNDDAMLEVAIAGKKSVVKEYWQVLKEIDLPSCTSLLLHQQMGIIEKDLAEIKTLDDIS